MVKVAPLSFGHPGLEATWPDTTSPVVFSKMSSPFFPTTVVVLPAALIYTEPLAVNAVNFADGLDAAMTCTGIITTIAMTKTTIPVNNSLFTFLIPPYLLDVKIY
jgi:UDP-N-acetylmuramyl pentapeptide phosphotransferase/UDP-N-acetylglucosamine-1-phosphate transferase